MRLDMKNDAELARRKGTARKTILAVLWLGFCFVLAYFVTGWLLDTDTINMSFFYNQLRIPRTVDEVFIRIGMIVVFVFIMQFFVLIGFAFSSPQGRLRPGNASVYSRNPDPNESKYDYH